MPSARRRPDSMIGGPVSLIVTAVAIMAAGPIVVGCSVPSFVTSDEASPAREPESSIVDPSVSVLVGEEARVVRVIDGDSVVVTLDNTGDGGDLTIRLLSYNAPELYQPGGDTDRDGSQDTDRDGSQDTDRDGSQDTDRDGSGDTDRDGSGGTVTCNGEAAKAALEAFLGQGPILVVGDGFDRFSRRLADLVVEGQSAGDYMIASGWGLAIGDRPEGRTAMKAAAKARRGMWGETCGRAESDALVLGEIQVDPSGSDRDNLNDEWVTIGNLSPEAFPLDRWVLSDDTTGHRFELSGTIEPLSSLVVRSGSGESTNSDFYLNETFPVWSNNGETVLLVDPAGVVAAWAFID